MKINFLYYIVKIIIYIILFVIFGAAIWFGVSDSYWHGMGERTIITFLLFVVSTVMIGPLSLYIILIKIWFYCKKKYNLSRIVLTVTFVSWLILTPVLWFSIATVTSKVLFPRRTYTGGFLKRIELSCEPEQIRFWTLDFINDTNNFYTEWKFKKVNQKWKLSFDGYIFPDFTLNINPDFVTDIYPEPNYRGEFFRLKIMEQDSIKYANIYLGRDKGISVGPTNLVLKENSQLLKWKPGIYVWSDH